MLWGLFSEQKTRNGTRVRDPDPKPDVRLARNVFLLGFFIIFVWALSMVPDVYLDLRPLPEIIQNGTARIFLISGLVLSFYGLLYVRGTDLLSSGGEMTTFGIILFCTLALAGVWFHAGYPAAFVPLTLVAMLLTVLFSSRLAIESLFFLTVLITVCYLPPLPTGNFLDQPLTRESSFLFEVFMLIPGSTLAAYQCASIRKRTRPLESGLYAGLIHAVLILTLPLLINEGLDGLYQTQTRILIGTGIAISGGIASGAILLVLLPVIEAVFEVPTDMGLLELTDMNQPALRKLAMEAPGTYHHSLRVGTLSEAGAEAIGANALMARVGAYYHDIGKTTKPGYFVENNTDGENPHERLPSNMSKLILLGHVKDGLKLADKYGLPRWIKDFIEQHHGTSVTEYFFHKHVREKIEKGEPLTAESADFRYPGPKPQRKEIGICMLADVVEATSRSLDNPTPSDIDSLVSDLFWKLLKDGQMDEAGLTIGEMKTIHRAFVEVLTGMFHARPVYPDQEPQAETPEETSDTDPGGTNAISTSEDDSGETRDIAETEREQETVGEDTEHAGSGRERSKEANPVSGDKRSTPGETDNNKDTVDSNSTPEIFILNQQENLDIDAERYRDLARFVLDAEGVVKDVNIVFLGTTEMQSMHKKYLDKDEPTDVLSFPYNDNQPDNLLGEVMVCPAVARRRASDRDINHTSQVETQLYVIHGILHLLGYDDKSEEDRQNMETRQEELLDAFRKGGNVRPKET